MHSQFVTFKFKFNSANHLKIEHITGSSTSGEWSVRRAEGAGRRTCHPSEWRNINANSRAHFSMNKRAAWEACLFHGMRGGGGPPVTGHVCLMFTHSRVKGCAAANLFNSSESN